MKQLLFDRSGFIIVLRTLTEDRFQWPRREEAVVTLSIEQPHWSLDSIDIDAMISHPVRQDQIASSGRVLIRAVVLRGSCRLLRATCSSSWMPGSQNY